MNSALASLSPCASLPPRSARTPPSFPPSSSVARCPPPLSRSRSQSLCFITRGRPESTSEIFCPLLGRKYWPSNGDINRGGWSHEDNTDKYLIGGGAAPAANE